MCLCSQRCRRWLGNEALPEGLSRRQSARRVCIQSNANSTECNAIGDVYLNRSSTQLSRWPGHRSSSLLARGLLSKFLFAQLRGRLAQNSLVLSQYINHPLVCCKIHGDYRSFLTLEVVQAGSWGRKELGNGLLGLDPAPTEVRGKALTDLSRCRSRASTNLWHRSATGQLELSPLCCTERKPRGQTGLAGTPFALAAAAGILRDLGI